MYIVCFTATLIVADGQSKFKLVPEMVSAVLAAIYVSDDCVI